jgi:hypothetical protein
MTPKRKRPPLGVVRHWLWAAWWPEPTVAQLLDRYREVEAAVQRYRAAGLEPKREWLVELGVLGVR